MTRDANTRQATTHTPEPWRIIGRSCRDREGAEIGTGNKTVAVVLTADTVEVTEEERANARRICAAVNACEGLGTEALERGIVAELRHMLRELVSAAGDLDAAIDGVTGQFGTERQRLNAALRAAQAVLEAGLELSVHELLAGRKQIAAVWSVEDVQAIRPDLTGEQAWQVLQRADTRHDATLGITWDTLEIIAEDLFGPAPATDPQA